MIEIKTVVTVIFDSEEDYLEAIKADPSIEFNRDEIKKLEKALRKPLMSSVTINQHRQNR